MIIIVKYLNIWWNKNIYKKKHYKYLNFKYKILPWKISERTQKSWFWRNLNRCRASWSFFFFLVLILIYFITIIIYFFWISIIFLDFFLIFSYLKTLKLEVNRSNGDGRVNRQRSWPGTRVQARIRVGLMGRHADPLLMKRCRFNGL